MKSVGDRIIKRVRNRLNHLNKNWVAVIVGETGSGKSYSAIRIAKAIDPTFTIGRVCFTPEEFMDLVDDPDLKPGNVLVFDEAGAGLSHRDWYKEQQKDMMKYFQIWRRRNLGLILTTPDVGFVDKQLRGIYHTYISTQQIDFEKEVCWVKWKNREFNPNPLASKDKRYYYKYPRVKENREVRVVERVAIKKPSKKLVEKYEKRKAEYTKKIRKDILKKLKERRKKEEKLSDDQIIEKVLAKPDRYFKKWGDKMIANRELIMYDFNVGKVRGSKLKKVAERKYQAEEK